MVNKLSEGVGKKIVEALKQQSEIEITPQQSGEDIQDDLSDLLNAQLEEDANEEMSELGKAPFAPVEPQQVPFQQIQQNNVGINNFGTPSIQKEQPFTPFNAQAAATPLVQEATPAFLEDTGFELPNNIAVLKKLILQLPSGVTKHTGAQIIKQTMEALGISMKSVLQEAQQVQDNLNHSAKECHETIAEYKRQIMALERQSQNYQKQYAALNDLISLFIQT